MPWSRSRRSLGVKLMRVLALVGGVGAGAIALMLTIVIMPSFRTLERDEVAQQIDHSRAMLDAFAAKTEEAARDYGDWESGRFAATSMAGEDAEHVPLIGSPGLTGIAYVAADGRIIDARWRDPTRPADDSAMRAELVRLIDRTDFARLLGTNGSAHFYARIGDRLAAIGVAHERHASVVRPRGMVVLARTLDPALLSVLLGTPAMVPLRHVGNEPLVARSAERLTITVPIAGMEGHPVAAARFTVARNISLLGQHMLLLATAGTVVLLGIVLAALRRLVASVVLRPLRRVEVHMQAVRASGTLTPLEEEARDDEIGALGRSFNAMLAQLKDLREQVEVQSFAVGRSESAIAVMHNVRNALSPISTILSHGIAMPSPVDRASVDRALAELARDDTPPARRRRLVAFLAAAVEAEASDRAARREQLEIGREAMAHVLEIIGTQQAQALEKPVIEPVDVTELIARNATIARYANGPSIAFSFPARRHLVMANRLLLSQVIGNLFANAGEAIAAGGLNSGTITVMIGEARGITTIAIRDDGEGFPPEVAPTLFQRGFSTREHKSGGLGLHWCANSMNAMGGALRLASDGRGTGAVATLTIAAAAPEHRAEAA